MVNLVSSPEQSIPFTPEEWERLLAPLSNPSSVGEFLLYEGTYDKIKAARREDDATLTRHEWDIELKKADWPQVRQLCLEALTSRSKDLQIAVWLTEALLHLHGYKGLKAGIQFIIQLIEKYWENVYPPIDETDQDLDLRISPLQWLNHDKFVLQLGVVPITTPTGDTPTYTVTDREKALLLEKLPQPQKETAIGEGETTITQFLTSVTLTPDTFYISLVTDLQESINLVNKLNQILDEYCANQAPSFSKLRQKLIDIQHIINFILTDRKPASKLNSFLTEESKQPILLNEDSIEEQPIKTKAMPIQNRSEAYQRLAEIADYLSEIEPHSPTPYLIKRAISWGNMSLTDLLPEMINDERDLTAIYTLLGIKKKS